MTKPPATQAFYMKRRGYQAAQGLIFLVFGGSCIYQALIRYGGEGQKVLNSWWFFAILSLGFLYLTAEAFFKVFYTRLVFTAQEMIQVDFPRSRHIPWGEVERIGEIHFKDKKMDFGITLRDSALEKDGLLAVPFIPLTPYFSSWNESPLRAWLKEYKPNLIKG